MTTEWKAYCQYMAKQPKNNMKEQLKQLVSNDMLVSMFMYFIASVEFSQMKLVKTHLSSNSSDFSLSSHASETKRQAN